VSEIVTSKVNLLSCHIVVASSKESDQTEIDKTVQPARVMLLISLVVALTRVKVELLRPHEAQRTVAIDLYC